MLIFCYCGKPKIVPTLRIWSDFEFLVYLRVSGGGAEGIKGTTEITLAVTRYGRPHTVFGGEDDMAEAKHTADDLKIMQSLPLEMK